MTVERSKRRCFLTLTFLVKSVSKNLYLQSTVITIYDDCLITRVHFSCTVHAVSCSDINVSEKNKINVDKMVGVMVTTEIIKYQ